MTAASMRARSMDRRPDQFREEGQFITSRARGLAFVDRGGRVA